MTILKSQTKQHGASLFIALVILIVLSLIGVSTMRSAIVQERMNGNLRDKQLAFEAAEAALRDAESFIEGIVTTGAFDGTNGLYGADSALPGADTAWNDSNSTSYSGTFPQVSSQPRYRIQITSQFGEVIGAANIGGYGYLRPQPPTTSFRIIARGTGGSDNAVVILTSDYGRRISQ